MDENPLDGYSPFADAELREAVPPVGDGALGAEPAAVGSDSGSDAEIRAYEARLNALENHLNNQAAQLSIAQETGEFEEPPNFPRFHPIVHFDIEEVPEDLRIFANSAMLGWGFMLAALALNWLGCLLLLGAGDACESPGSKIALATLYLFIIAPIALDFDALDVYRALRDGSPSSTRFVKMLTCIGITAIFEALQALGFESSGSCGLVTMVSVFAEGHWAIGTFAILVTLALAFAAYFHYDLAAGLWRYYRGTEQGENLQDNMRRTIATFIVEALQKK